MVLPPKLGCQCLLWGLPSKRNAREVQTQRARASAVSSSFCCVAAVRVVRTCAVSADAADTRSYRSTQQPQQPLHSRDAL